MTHGGSWLYFMSASPSLDLFCFTCAMMNPKQVLFADLCNDSTWYMNFLQVSVRDSEESETGKGTRIAQTEQMWRRSCGVMHWSGWWGITALWMRSVTIFSRMPFHTTNFMRCLRVVNTFPTSKDFHINSTLSAEESTWLWEHLLHLAYTGCFLKCS